MVEELLKTYDLFHCSLISGGVVDLDINYYGVNNVEIKVKGIFNKEETVKSFDFLIDNYYETFIFPKIVQRYLSKNLNFSLTKNNKDLMLKRDDNKSNMMLTNCPSYHVLIVENLMNSFKKINDFSKENKLSFIDYSNSDLYILTNIICDIAYYNTKFKKSAFMLDLKNYQTVEEISDFKRDIRNELVLNVAKFVAGYKDKSSDTLWEDILEKFHDDPAIAEVIHKFEKENFKETSIYTKALEYAEYEYINSYVIRNNEEAYEEATVACINGINFFSEEYLNYWRERKTYYETINEMAKITMCDNFINNYYLKGVENVGDVDFLDKLKKLKEEPKENSFFKIFNEPIVDVFEEDSTYEDIKVGALDQAKRLIDIIKERDILEKDAEEFAKEILRVNKEQETLKKDAEKQAAIIMNLQKENEHLKEMADENAKYLIERNKMIEDEEELRKYIRTYPVKRQDIDKINALMVAISDVKPLDFAIAHPTVMNYLIILEEKIITYLKTHTNIINERDLIVPIEIEEMYESKSVTELLSMIKNAYDTSKILLKEGRKTLINFTPVDEDTYRLALYSIKGDEEETLMDAFFEDYLLTDDALKELCNIFKDNSVIVASKIDNLPFDRADYLVIDNVNNALKFMDCPRKLIDRVKNYI